MLLILLSGVAHAEASEGDFLRAPCGKESDASSNRETLNCIPVSRIISPITESSQRRIQRGNRKNQHSITANHLNSLFAVLSTGAILYAPYSIVTEGLSVVHTHLLLTNYLHRSDGKKKV